MKPRSVPWPCPACKPLFCSMECTNPECGNFREVESEDRPGVVTSGPGHSVEFEGRKFYLDTVGIDVGRGPERALCFLFIDNAWVIRCIAAFQAGPGKDETWVKDKAGVWHRAHFGNAPIQSKVTPKIDLSWKPYLMVVQAGVVLVEITGTHVLVWRGDCPQMGNTTEGPELP